MRVLTLTSIVALCVGCGGSDLDLHPAGGTVTYNGDPVANATVSFIPESGPMATGTTDEQGSFALRTGAEHGALTGTYAVTVYAVGGTATSEVTADPSDPTAYAAAYEQAAQQQEQQETTLLVPEQYTQQLTTPLSYEVTAGGPNQFEITLSD